MEEEKFEYKCQSCNTIVLLHHVNDAILCPYCRNNRIFRKMPTKKPVILKTR